MELINSYRYRETAERALTYARSGNRAFRSALEGAAGSMPGCRAPKP